MTQNVQLFSQFWTIIKKKHFVYIAQCFESLKVHFDPSNENSKM